MVVVRQGFWVQAHQYYPHSVVTSETSHRYWCRGNQATAIQHGKMVGIIETETPGICMSPRM